MLWKYFGINVTCQRRRVVQSFEIVRTGQHIRARRLIKREERRRAAYREIARGHFLLAADGARETRQLRERVLRVLGEQLAAHVQQTFFTPAGRGFVLQA